MNEFFGFDGPFIRGMNKIVDFFLLSLLWMICCLPLITIGVSTTAFYYTFHKTICQDMGNVWSCFWNSFKGNAKQSTLLFIIQISICTVVILNCFAVYLMYQTLIPKPVAWMIWGISLLVIMWTGFWLPYQARFTDTIKKILQNSAYMFMKNFIWSISLMLILLVVLLIGYKFKGLLIPLYFAYMALYSIIYERIFRKYLFCVVEE